MRAQSREPHGEPPPGRGLGRLRLARGGARPVTAALTRGGRRLRVGGLLLCALVALGACGGASEALSTSPEAGAIPTPKASKASGELRDWTEFGLDPQRSDATDLATGIDAANVKHLRRIHVALPGTVDSSPIYLHGAVVAGKRRNVIAVTTTYGRTLAIDADSGRTLWTFTPHGYARWAGSAQITTASPIADPGHRFVYAASPDGRIHKLALANGSEDREGKWPVSVTRDPTHEKLAAALNIDGRYVIAATGGYYGDAPPYQGHVALIDRESGHLAAVFNTLCSNRRQVIAPSSCSSSDSAILSRAGAVVEPGGHRILISTGNGPWNGRTDFGDSVLELELPRLRLRQAYTPADQERLNQTDTDLGSSGPALLDRGHVAIAGKDGVLRLLSLARLDGRRPAAERGHGGGSAAQRLGGALQRLPLAGGGELFTAPAVWHAGGRTTMFIADEHATAAYVLRDGRLRRAWESPIAGTSPILAGGLLYVYEPDSGGIEVYRPGSPRPIASLPGSPGHWNSPIVVDGHVVEPEGNANDHALTGSLEIFSAR